jgi:DNA-binding LytR/AlgR family response regulator
MNTHLPIDRILVSDSNGRQTITTKKIAFITAARNYCTIHYMERNGALTSTIVSRPMAHYAKLLSDCLIKAHRNTVVHKRYISGTRGPCGIVLSCTDTVLKGSREGIKLVRAYIDSSCGPRR